jgi:hypothetical protein
VAAHGGNGGGGGGGGDGGVSPRHATATPLPGVCCEPAAAAASSEPSSSPHQPHQPQQHAVSYLVTTPAITGKFHVAAARALGLPP